MSPYARRAPVSGRLGLGLVALVALGLGVAALEIAEVLPDYRVSSAVIVACGALVAWRHGMLTLQTIVFMIIFYPALTPVYSWDLNGAELFSWAARYLQSDLVVVSRTVYLFAVAALAYTAAVLPVDPTRRRPVTPPPAVRALPSGILWGVAACVVISAYVIDPGPTILTSSYSAVLAGRLDASILTVVLSSSFGGFWAVLFVFGRHRPWILWTATAIAVLWLFLHARRVEVFGIALILLLWARYKVPPGRIAAVAIVFLMLQISVEFVRIFGLFTLISGEVDAFSLEVAMGYGRLSAPPGGAGNLFLSAMHLVNVRDASEITGVDTLTMVEWPRAILPNAFWGLLGAPPVVSEHDTIYTDLELAYIGGMPLMAAFYLNGGIFLVFLTGAVHGALSNLVDRVIHTGFATSLNVGGSFGMFLAAVFVMYQFRYHWYNPQTMLRVMFYALVIYLAARVFMRIRATLSRSPEGAALAEPGRPA